MPLVERHVYGGRDQINGQAAEIQPGLWLGAGNDEPIVLSKSPQWLHDHGMTAVVNCAPAEIKYSWEDDAAGDIDVSVACGLGL